MGQRANYILIESDRQQIYYNKWRANCIANDLYLGEKQFLKFVRKCDPSDSIIDEVWIEGCVVIDIKKHCVYFWSLELGYDSAVEYYLTKLKQKWAGWEITYVKNQMYDIERVLNINYLTQAESLPMTVQDEKPFILEETEDWIYVTAVIKTDSGLHTVQSANFSVDSVLMFGPPVIKLLLNKPATDLPKETDDYYKLIVIDDIDKKVILDQYEFGLLEQAQDKWPGYKLIIGDYGYIDALKLAGIETAHLIMSPQQIIDAFNEIVKPSSDFDYVNLKQMTYSADSLIASNPTLFQTTKSELTWLGKFKIRLRQFFNQG